MSNVRYTKLREHPSLVNDAALWFSSIWKIPESAYFSSMEMMLKEKNAVPQWYLVLYNENIIAGVGVIENDFHPRKDLTPNVCALYVIPEYRSKGIAGQLLAYVEDDMKDFGVKTLYLLTDHNSFYERYGWKFHTEVQGDGEEQTSRMYIKR